MAPRLTSRLLVLGTFGVLSFLTVLLWRSPSSLSSTSIWIWPSSTSSASHSTEHSLFDGPALPDASELDLDGLGGGPLPEGESKQEGGEGKGEGGKLNGSPRKPFLRSFSSLSVQSLTFGSTTTSATYVLQFRPSSKYPSFPPLLPEDLSALRVSYLARLTNMTSFQIGMNRTHNDRMLTELVKCLKDGNLGEGPCAKEVPRVVVVSLWFFKCGLEHCHTTGEVIWLAPVAASMERQGIFTLVMNEDELPPLHHQLGDIITQFWMEEKSLLSCVDDPENCLQSLVNPKGLPVWKLFALTFWGSPPGLNWFHAPDSPWSYNPLGNEWTLVPYEMPDDHTYLGFNFEGCYDTPVIPASERHDTIFLLAKFVEYFYAGGGSWPVDMYQKIVNTTGLEILTTAKIREGDPVDKYVLPAGLTPLGQLSKEDYSRTVGSARVLLGIGKPYISPSPYAALVPVILPSFYPADSPSDLVPTGWDAFTSPVRHQHAPAGLLGPPYVYTVNLNGKNALGELEKAIRSAWENPIGRYVPPAMTVSALDARVAQHLSIDWETVGKARMKERGWKEVWIADHLKISYGKPRFGKE